MISNSSDLKSYHRSDIQGLRGIAVLLVVIYHTGIALPGGFVGVDMFFVISGFVITQVLMREFEETGTIRLSNFYARRARRLIPALSLIVVFTLLISLVAMSPFGEQQQIIKTAIASVFFAGNIHLFAQNTYDALKNNPLRHLWSLGVEEQFYWIYPVFLVALLRIAKKQFEKVLMIVLAAIAIISFGIGVLLTYGFEFGYTEGSLLSSQFGLLSKIGFQPGSDWPTKFAFFGAPARFWEILVGAVLAVRVNKLVISSKFGSRFLVVVGVGAISWATLMISPISKFPGFIALLPVAGTALLILCGNQSKICNDLLGSRQLVYIGDISYSLYLWHWPMIVFARVIWPDIQVTGVIASGLSIIPAGLSFRFIETRLRSKPTDEKKYGNSILAFLVIVPLVFSLGLQKAANTGLGITRVEDGNNNYAAQIQENCGEYQKSFETKCASKVGKSSFLVYLYGDSNANAASTGVAEAVFELGGSLVVANGSGCPFLITAAMKKCESFNEIRFDAIKRNRPDLVIIVNLQSNYLSNEIYQPWGKSENMLKSLSETLLWLDNLGISAIVQGEIPFCDFKVNLLSRYSLKRQSCWRNYDQQLGHLELLYATGRLTKNFERHYFFDPRLT
ncbi:MAG: acyltransferase family protein, partial [Actinobacteria bacterium]|nr:acyltransferase family protein [Actinomycetota bacterium]